MNRWIAAALLSTSLAAAAQEVSVDGRFSGSWFDPDRSGEGWVLQVLDDSRAFLAWFTYPPEIESERRQAWLVGEGSVEGDTVVFDNLQQFSGPRFGSEFDPADALAEDWGRLELVFSDCANGALSYTGPAPFGAAERNVVRLTEIVDAPCDAIKGAATRRPLSSAWFDPSHSGEGWFMEELSDGRVNLYWFTYDDLGRPTWMTGTGPREGDRVSITDLLLVTGPLFGEAFDPNAVTLEPWGNLTFELDSCDSATLTYASTLPGFGEGRLSPVRLTRIRGIDCVDLPIDPLVGGSWKSVPTSPTPRSEVSAAVLDGEAYLVGGFGGPRKVESYAIDRGTWRSHPDLPQGKNHHMAVGHAGEVYAFGGFSESTFNSTRTAFALDPANGQWRQIADLPLSASAANVALSLGDAIYLVGGNGTTFQPQRYLPAEDRYEALPAPNDRNRDHSSAVVFEGEIWLLGGRGAQIGASRAVEIFDPVAMSWRNGPSLVEARSGFGSAVVQGQIMAVGGEVFSGQSFTLDGFEVFAPASGSFQSGPPMPQTLHGIVAVSLDGQLLVLGGSSVAGQVVPAGSYYLYQPAVANVTR